MGRRGLEPQIEESLGVNKVVRKPTAKQPEKKTRNTRCYRCGQEGHISSDTSCPAHQTVCSKCNIVGHYVSICRTKTDSGAASGN